MIKKLVKPTLFIILCFNALMINAQVKVTPDGGTPLPPGYEEKQKESVELKKAAEKVASGRKLMKEAQRLMDKGYNDLNTALINEATVLYMDAAAEIQLGLNFSKHFYIQRGLPYNTKVERELLHLIDRCKKNQQSKKRYTETIEAKIKGVQKIYLISQNVIATGNENDYNYWSTGINDDVKKPEIELYSGNMLEVYSANGGDGLKYKGSDKIVIPAKIDFHIVLVTCSNCKEGQKLNKQFFAGKLSGEYGYTKLFDQTGKVIIDFEFRLPHIYMSSYKHYVSESALTNQGSTYSYRHIFEDRTPKGEFELVIMRVISTVERKGGFKVKTTSKYDVITYDNNMNLLKTKRQTFISYRDEM